MKVTRKMLLTITASLGALIIIYSLVRYFTGRGFSEAGEKYMMDVVVIAALGLFMYNRKMAKDEKRAREAAEEAERRRLEGEEPEEEPPEDKNLPHWERYRSKESEEDTEDENTEDWEYEDSEGDTDS
jgi:hypothetical protein